MMLGVKWLTIFNPVPAPIDNGLAICQVASGEKQNKSKDAGDEGLHSEAYKHNIIKFVWFNLWKHIIFINSPETPCP